LVIFEFADFYIIFLIEAHYDFLGERAVTLNGRERITLEPQNWLGKKFPLTNYFQEHFDETARLRNIRTIILIHADCLRCQKLIKEFENQKDNNVILIALPDKIKSAKIQTALPVFKLNDKKDWFAVTPCVITLQNGICVTIKEY
jgi:hypothetical protein